jgi:phosphoribosylformylglycinamidine cyclo-ligase
VFAWIQQAGQIQVAEMFRVFNMGIGMILVVSEYYAESIVRALQKDADTPAWIIGEVVPGRGDVRINVPA